MLFAVVAALITATTLRHKVYHRVTVTDVRLAILTPDGYRRPVPTPAAITHPWNLSAPGPVVKRIESQIHAFDENWEPGLRSMPHGSRLEWTIRYGYDRRTPDRERVIITTPSAP